MNIQFDIKPVFIGLHQKDLFLMETFIGGQVITSTVNKQTVDYMLKQGIVSKVKRQLRNDETGDLETFEYENGVDGSGVMYTSTAYKVQIVN